MHTAVRYRRARGLSLARAALELLPSRGAGAGLTEVGTFFFFFFYATLPVSQTTLHNLRRLSFTSRIHETPSWSTQRLCRLFYVCENDAAKRAL